MVFLYDRDEHTHVESYQSSIILDPNQIKLARYAVNRHAPNRRIMISHYSNPLIRQNCSSTQTIPSRNNELKTKLAPHLTAPTGVPSSPPWISRWFSLTKALSLAGFVSVGSLRLEGEPALPLVEAEWPPEKAGAPREERPPEGAMRKFAVLLLPSSISAIAGEQEIAGGVRGTDGQSGRNPNNQTGEDRKRWGRCMLMPGWEAVSERSRTGGDATASGLLTSFDWHVEHSSGNQNKRSLNPDTPISQSQNEQSRSCNGRKCRIG